ncbi:uncharacterized protein LAESUDRAFT_713803 [Laetiporus sulphureus 93-53]|uniref:Uncharacterized protein n=1 Tax=Laetiporus sulphureus 93-53 TaxID=1314785 RepID=A0A165EFM5_9APHY|nr:uncharacterized protein LAESUDRAFT_713803 [Laetiporus sulphureus 93-53]KZT06957.1 hypothetical protein LAESUDRAFT_713803 [Laetiporus sulphureus 93-53]
MAFSAGDWMAQIRRCFGTSQQCSECYHPSGMSKVSLDNRLLVANNITTRFDMYKIPSGLHWLSVRAPSKRPDMILPVLIHDGPCLLCASDGEHIQTLRMRDRVPVQALSRSAKIFSPPTRNAYMIAAATSIAGAMNDVQIWYMIDVDVDVKFEQLRDNDRG